MAGEGAVGTAYLKEVACCLASEAEAGEGGSQCFFPAPKVKRVGSLAGWVIILLLACSMQL